MAQDTSPPPPLRPLLGVVVALIAAGELVFAAVFGLRVAALAGLATGPWPGRSALHALFGGAVATGAGALVAAIGLVAALGLALRRPWGTGFAVLFALLGIPFGCGVPSVVLALALAGAVLGEAPPPPPAPARP